jgi:hypothetical protein
MRHNHIGVEANEVGREHWKSVQLLRRMPLFEDDVFPFLISVFS